MKHIISFGKLNESNHIYLPADGDYKELNQSEYNSFLTQYPTCKLDITNSAILLDTLQALAEKCVGAAISNRGGSLSYRIQSITHWIDIDMRTDNWFAIDAQVLSDTYKYICDGEDGLNKFIEDFTGIMPMVKSMPIKESLNNVWPADGKYSKLTGAQYIEFKGLCTYQYEKDSNKLIVDSISFISKLFSDENCRINPTRRSIVFDTQYKSMKIYGVPHVDSWFIFRIMTFDTNHPGNIGAGQPTSIDLYLCDGEDGVTEFLKDCREIIENT